MTRYRIAYLTSDDPKDRNKSSGVYYYQSKALENHCGTVHLLGPVDSLLIKIIRKFINGLNRILKYKINHFHSKTIALIYGGLFERRLKNLQGLDFIFAEKASCEIAYLKTSIPIVYSTDATFKSLLNYYPGYTHLSKHSIQRGNLIEQRAINNAKHIICSSGWAGKSVNLDYGFPHDSINIIPRGANIDNIVEWELVFARKKSDTCRLLFIGKEWERKGYETAYQTMDYIRASGLDVKLTVVGFTPPLALMDTDVEVISYIDKNTKEGMELFTKVMTETDFFILPTWAECLGIVFCEASSYGLISITRNTGGVSEVVKDGVNGFVLDYNSTPKDFGDKIIKVYNDNELYYSMIVSSREYFEERLNWEVWGAEMKKVFDKLYVLKK